MDISIAEAHNRLSHWIKQVRNEPDHDYAAACVGVIMAPEDYERLQAAGLSPNVATFIL
jgi:hypothetical protein